MKDSMEFVGIVTLELFGPSGELKQTVVKQNMITNHGRAIALDLLDGVVTPIPDEIAVGGSSIANAASMTNLVQHLGDASAAPSQPNDTTGNPGYISRVAATFISGVGSGTIQEVGRQQYAGTTNPSLCSRVVLTGGDIVNKGASDSLVVTYDITYASSA